VAGVGAALVAHDRVVLVAQQVDDLPLGLITPLQTDDTSRWHVRTPGGDFLCVAKRIA
jgi:hypothetical protein